MVYRALLFWVPMPFIAILNAAIREKLLVRFLDEQRSHQLSTILLIILIAIYTWIIYPWLKIDIENDAWFTGFIWLLLTIAFEFLAGRYVFKNPWDRLFADYDLTRGRLWGVFLISLVLLPYIIFYLHQ